MRQEQSFKRNVAWAVACILASCFGGATFAKADSIEDYRPVALHPKSHVPGSAGNERGFVNINFADGTVETVSEAAWESNYLAGLKKRDLFWEAPSANTFAALTEVQKFEAAEYAMGRGFEYSSAKDPSGVERQVQTFFDSRSAAEQQRIATVAFASSVDSLNGGDDDGKKISRSAELFKRATNGDPRKAQHLICQQLYNYVADQFVTDIGEKATDVLSEMAQSGGTIDRSCPTKYGAVPFSIRERFAQLKQHFAEQAAENAESDVAENSDDEETPAQVEVRVWSLVKCSKEDLLSELKDVELDFVRTPGPHTNWFRRSVGACRFQGSVKKIANGKFEFRLQAALPGEVKVSPLPFKDFAELKVKLNLADDKSKNKSADKSLGQSIPANSVSEDRSVRIAR